MFSPTSSCFRRLLKTNSGRFFTRPVSGRYSQFFVSPCGPVDCQRAHKSSRFLPESEILAVENLSQSYQADKFVNSAVNCLHVDRAEAKTLLSSILLNGKVLRLTSGLLLQDLVFYEYFLAILAKHLGPEEILYNSNLFFTSDNIWDHFFSLRQAGVKLKLSHFVNPKKLWALSLKEWQESRLVDEDINIVENIISSLIVDRSERARVSMKLRELHPDYHKLPLSKVKSLISQLMFSEMSDDKITESLRSMFPTVKQDLSAFTSLFYPSNSFMIGYLVLADPHYFSHLARKHSLHDKLLLKIPVLVADYHGLTTEKIIISSRLYRQKIGFIIACLNSTIATDPSLHHPCLVSAAFERLEEDWKSHLFDGNPLNLEITDKIIKDAKISTARVLTWLVIKRLGPPRSVRDLNLFKQKLSSEINLEEFNIESAKKKLDDIVLNQKITFSEMSNIDVLVNKLCTKGNDSIH